MKKHISIVLLATILLQSCVAYQKTSVSLEQAHNKGNVKMVDMNGHKHRIKNIEMKDSIYYAFIDEKRIRLHETQISSIYLQDKKKSNTQTTFFWVTFSAILLVGFIALLGAMINAIEEDLNSI